MPHARVADFCLQWFEADLVDCLANVQFLWTEQAVLEVLSAWP